MQLSAKMKGIWENAFGIKYISFGNIAVSIGIVPGVSVTEFGNASTSVLFCLSQSLKWPSMMFSFTLIILFTVSEGASEFGGDTNGEMRSSFAS